MTRLVRYSFGLLIPIFFFLTFSPRSLAAAELPFRYGKIIFDGEEQLAQFNNKLYIGRLNSWLQTKKNLTVTDEVRSKLDLIVEKVETVLEMFPARLILTVRVYDTPSGVQQAYLERYHRSVDYIAFFSPTEDTLFVNVKKLNLQVIAHELGHAVVDNYFNVSPSVKIHELLAQFAEAHVLD
jgi:hypothetical protein